MSQRAVRRSVLAVLLSLCAALLASNSLIPPAAWRDADMAGYRTPLAALGQSPRLVPQHEYYALPEVNIKTYPVYTPDKEPPHYIDWLKQQDVQPLVDVSKLHTESDWIAAGKEVFYGRELPRYTGSEDNLQLIRNPKVLEAYRLQTASDGVLLGLRYVIREKGKVELGTDTCAMCHAQIIDGQVVEGPPNNYTPFGPLMGDLTRRYAQFGSQFFDTRRRAQMREDYRVPYLKDDINLKTAELPAEQIAELYDRVPAGVYMRTNTSLNYPVKIANLIGIQNFRYFDRTGTARQRDITDLMRYIASIADVTDALTLYGDAPEGKIDLPSLGLKNGIHRTPDPLLYALALYLYSLKAPPNPNAFDATAARGQHIFEQEQCARCHTPPFYSSSKLTIAKGFRPSEEERLTLDIIDISVGTDPGLALQTRKGTGFYRVPSLRMVWANAAFLHDGAIGSLEEMFDPARLKPGFRSSNWKSSAPSHAVDGHPFGLELNGEDRSALIKFLKTL